MPRKLRKGSRRSLDYTKKQIAELQSSDPILFGMAKGPWALQWADMEEEKGRSFSGQDIYEEAPNPPSDAIVWAEDITAQLKRLNMVRSLNELFQIAQDRGYDKDEETFGMYLGCQVAGHGISWSDNLQPGDDKAIELPRRDFYV